MTINDSYVNSFWDSNGVLPRLINLHENIKSLKCFFSLNRSLELQDFLFEGKSSVYTSLFYERGSSQPIHRDVPYFWTSPANKY